jgi:phage I-like protein
MNTSNNAHKTVEAIANELGVSGTIIGEYSSAPEWIELLPAGDFAGRDGRGPFRLSNPAAVVTATSGLKMDAGLPIDYDHATDFAAPSGRPAPAAGWIRAIEVRDGALWGRVEWTSHGRSAVVTREYRYISPVFEYSQDGEVQRLLRAALTNNPNLYLTAISARAARGESVFPKVSVHQHTGAAQDRSQQRESADGLESQLRQILGLDSESKPEEIAAEVSRVIAERRRGNTVEEDTPAAFELQSAVVGSIGDPARYVPIEQFENILTELNQLRATSSRERASYRVDAAMKAGKLVPAQREWAIAYCQANLSGFEEFITRQPAMVAGVTTGFDGEPAAARNGIGGRHHEGLASRSAGAMLTRTELTVCARLGLKPNDYLQRRNARSEVSMPR